MTNNTLRAHLAFSFKGEDYALETTVDLDHCLAQSSEVPSFHHLLARVGNIDTYSYLFEVFESYDIEFDQPSGLAVAYCTEGAFDWYGFVQHLRNQGDLEAVRVLAAQTLDMHEFDARPELRAALLAAYRAGKKTE